MARLWWACQSGERGFIISSLPETTFLSNGYPNRSVTAASGSKLMSVLLSEGALTSASLSLSLCRTSHVKLKTNPLGMLRKLRNNMATVRAGMADTIIGMAELVCFMDAAQAHSRGFAPELGRELSRLAWHQPVWNIYTLSEGTSFRCENVLREILGSSLHSHTSDEATHF